MIRQKHIQSITDEMLVDILKKKVEVKKDAIPESELKEEAQKKEEEMAKKLHNLDKTFTKNWDVDFTFKLKEINISVSADSNDKVRGSSNEPMADFGIENQTIHLEKEGNKLRLNALGIKANSHFSFSQIYRYAMQTRDLSMIHSNNMAL